MRRRLRLAVSGLCGIAAFAVASLGISSVRAEAKAEADALLAEYGGDHVTVCVAARDIAPGTAVGETDIEQREWASALLPEGAATDLEDVLGRQATSRVPAGAVMADAYFERADDALEVPDGLVAVSVPSQSQLAIGGALHKGDLVDVYVSQAGLTEPLIAGASVIDLSTDDTGGDGSLDWVTIAVAPERVVDVLSASAQGSIALTLPGEGVGAIDGEADSDGDEGEVDVGASHEAEGSTSGGVGGSAPLDEADGGEGDEQ